MRAVEAMGQEATAAPPTALQKQLDRVDFAISAAGEISSTVAGVEQRDANSTHSVLTIKPSSTVGELFTLRYTAKAYAGFEFNYGNLRYTQDYTFAPPPEQGILSGGAQAAAREMTLGYVAHPRKIFGLEPFLGAGGGTIHFIPTAGGGQGLPNQYRAAYYYQVGVEGNFPGSHFGARLAFRQLIYLAPDFLENYLTITRRTVTSE
ncbi:MAG TPA: hypothetical protein VGU23_02800, partial [Acidobacteriaceae bacterium]|nr:hypothetical protein [Acidobacteriaceae bacterium]